jgi:ATP-dependent DNA ligase
LKPPAGSDWIHEIKHNGYRCRLQVRRDADNQAMIRAPEGDW